MMSVSPGGEILAFLEMMESWRRLQRVLSFLEKQVNEGV